MKKKRAFTLAEILIALALIGILSSVAIQTMRHRDSEDEYSALRGKSVINIQATMHQALFDQKAAEIYEDNGQTLWNDVVNRLDSRGTYSGTIDGDGTPYTFHGMRDGAYFAYTKYDGGQGSSVRYKISIDINGQTPPNKLGKDQVIWFMDKFGGMTPTPDENPCKDEPIKKYYWGGDCHECLQDLPYNVKTLPDVLCCEDEEMIDVNGTCCDEGDSYFDNAICCKNAHGVPVINTSTGQTDGYKCCENPEHNYWYDGACRVCKPEPYEYFRSGLCCTDSNHIRLEGPNGPYCGLPVAQKTCADIGGWEVALNGITYCLCDSQSCKISNQYVGQWQSNMDGHIINYGICQIKESARDYDNNSVPYPSMDCSPTNGSWYYQDVVECLRPAYDAVTRFIRGSLIPRYIEGVRGSYDYGLDKLDDTWASKAEQRYYEIECTGYWGGGLKDIGTPPYQCEGTQGKAKGEYSNMIYGGNSAALSGMKKAMFGLLYDEIIASLNEERLTKFKAAIVGTCPAFDPANPTCCTPGDPSPSPPPGDECPEGQVKVTFKDGGTTCSQCRWTCENGQSYVGPGGGNIASISGSCGKCSSGGGGGGGSVEGHEEQWCAEALHSGYCDHHSIECSQRCGRNEVVDPNEQHEAF